VREALPTFVRPSPVGLAANSLQTPLLS
jgi:hypothetical protein